MVTWDGLYIPLRNTIWVGNTLSYICFITSGILISHHIFQMLVRSSIPLRYKAAYNYDSVLFNA